MRAILVSVDYADLLAVTLPYNRKHFEDVCVVTSSADAATQRLALAHKAKLFVTDSFYDGGADFNKWKALEEGLDFFGREGWMCIMDADVLWPKYATVDLTMGYLHGPLRRMCNATVPAPPESAWGTFPVHRNVNEWAGYSQVFHCADPRLPPPPWHQVDWKHAGGADSFFQALWPPEFRIRFQWDCLHLGEAGKNWFGRATQLADGSRPVDADRKLRKVSALWVNRRHNQSTGKDRFEGEKL